MWKAETAGPDIPPHVAETVRAIALLHAEHHRKSTLAERIVDRITRSVGRPVFLLMLMRAMLLWMTINEFMLLSAGAAPDAPPFSRLELTISLLALVIAVMILISQSRADRFANLREQMTLEATLLTEQKTRKIIELLEELRRDSPGVRDREDVEARRRRRSRSRYDHRPWYIRASRPICGWCDRQTSLAAHRRLAHKGVDHGGSWRKCEKEVQEASSCTGAQG